MSRFAVVLVLAALATVGRPVPAVHAGGGPPTCCVCFNCASGPSCRVTPPISCDVVCQQLGCANGETGDTNTCSFFSTCDAAPAAVPAPAADAPALAAMLAALGVVGWRRVRGARR